MNGRQPELRRREPMYDRDAVIAAVDLRARPTSSLARTPEATETDLALPEPAATPRPAALHPFPSSPAAGVSSGGDVRLREGGTAIDLVLACRGGEPAPGAPRPRERVGERPQPPTGSSAAVLFRRRIGTRPTDVEGLNGYVRLLRAGALASEGTAIRQWLTEERACSRSAPDQSHRRGPRTAAPTSTEGMCRWAALSSRW